MSMIKYLARFGASMTASLRRRDISTRSNLQAAPSRVRVGFLIISTKRKLSLRIVRYWLCVQSHRRAHARALLRPLTNRDATDTAVVHSNLKTTVLIAERHIVRPAGLSTSLESSTAEL